MTDDLIEEVKILNDNNDIFNTYGKAIAITEFLNLDANDKLLSKNNFIAIYGSWGVGKSSLMKMVKNNIDKEKFDTIWYDTWKYENDDNLSYSLLKFICQDKFWTKFTEKGEKFLDDMYNLFKSFSKGLEINLGSLLFKPGVILESVKEDSKTNPQKSIWEITIEFEEIFSNLKFGKKKLVVFLDDLDRCDLENIISLISSIKLLLSINKNIIFVVGIDKTAVALSFKNKYNNDYNKADEYLEKMFPINFSIKSDLNYDNFKLFLSNFLSLDRNDAETILELFTKIGFNNSRHIKKVLRKYYSVKQYLVSKNIDLENKSNVILILYFIILNHFYSDEYDKIDSDKDSYYKNIMLVSHDSKTGIKKSAPFCNYNLICNCEYDSKGQIDIYPILKFFSPYKYINNEINCLKTLDGDGHIQYSNWQLLFDDNVCIRFLDFFLSDIKYFEPFLKDNNICIEPIEKIFKELEKII